MLNDNLNLENTVGSRPTAFSRLMPLIVSLIVVFLGSNATALDRSSPFSGGVEVQAQEEATKAVEMKKNRSSIWKDHTSLSLTGNKFENNDFMDDELGAGLYKAFEIRTPCYQERRLSEEVYTEDTKNNKYNLPELASKRVDCSRLKR